MTKIFPVPNIPKHQFDSFRRELGPDLPDTYDEWFEFVRKHRIERLRQGETVLDVEVDYNQFLRSAAQGRHNPI